MKLDAWLQGKAAWLTVPAYTATVVVMAAAVAYSLATLELVPHSGGLFLLVVSLTGGALVGTLALVGQTRLAPLRELARGQQVADDRQLLAAIRAVRGHGWAMAVTTGAAWVAGSAVAALAYQSAAGAPWPVALRLVAVGVAFGPAVAVLVGLQVTVRAHEIVSRLAAELPVSVVVEAFSASRAGVRERLVGATLFTSLLPLGLLVDLLQSLGTKLKDVVLAAPTLEARALLIDDGLDQLLLRGALLAVTFLLVAAAMGLAAGTVLADPMRRIADDAAKIARGELTRAQIVAADGEVWSVTAGFARMKERLLDLVLQLKRASERTGGATGTLLGSSKQYEQGASQQAAALNQTSATTEELAHSARQIAFNAGAVLEIADGTLKAADLGRESSEAFAAAVERMRRENRLISDAVERLKGRVQQIHRVVEVINGVADRSDLLALSAELEGTRAAEVGRGFSLVATEMRRLAENVLESTAEVEELIGEIREATLVTTDATQRGSQLAESSMIIADEVAQALKDVGDLARETSRAVRTISLATQQQQTGTDQLAEAMTDILTVTQQNLAATRALAEVNQRLGALSRNLDAAVDRFRIVS